MTIRYTISAVLIAWMGVCAQTPEARVPAGTRLRPSRCARLDIEHGSDHARDGESHSFDTSSARHQALGHRTGTGTISAGPADPIPAVLADEIRLSTPVIALDFLVIAYNETVPARLTKGVVRGRAPPLFHS